MARRRTVSIDGWSESDLAVLRDMAARSPTDVSQEIALLRFFIRAVAAGGGTETKAGRRRPELRMIEVLQAVGEGVERLVRALRVQRTLSGESADGLAAAMAIAIREIGLELGVDQ